MLSSLSSSSLLFFLLQLSLLLLVLLLLLLWLWQLLLSLLLSHTGYSLCIMTSQCQAIAGPSTSQAFEQWKRKCNEMSLHLAAIVMGLSWGSSLWPPFKLFFCSFFSWMHPFGIWGFPEDRMFLSFGNHVEHRPAFLYYLFGNWANNRGKVYDVQHTCALCRGGNSVICRGGCRGELSGPHYILWLRLYDDHSLTTQGQE